MTAANSRSTDQPDAGDASAAAAGGQSARGGVAAAARAALAAVADFLLPPRCLACTGPLADHNAICAACWRDVSFIRAPLCDRLGIPLPFATGDVMVSAEATANPPPWNRARAVAHHTGTMRRLVHQMKYLDRQDGRHLLARWLAEAGQELLIDADLIVPVPLARRRLLWRRFNQAALLADDVSQLSGVALDPLALRRRRNTPAQVGLTRAQRRQNVSGVFVVAPARVSAIAGRRVVLIDDVVTTGATIAACTRALLRAGAARVDVLSLARVVDTIDVAP